MPVEQLASCSTGIYVVWDGDTMMQINEFFWTQTDVGAFIHYALKQRVERVEGIMNYAPTFFITAFIC